MDIKQLYPIGKSITWPHPADEKSVQVQVVSYDVTAARNVEAVNVKGQDFIDGVAVGRLEADGSGLK